VTLFEPGDSSPARSGDDVAARTRLALVVAYDGTDFHGFAAQPGLRTVAGVLLEALEAMLRGDVEDFAVAGRTDAGVHAWGQVVSLSTAADVEPDRLAYALTKRLGPDVVVRSAQAVDGEFDARHSAVARTYRYTVVNRPAPDPFLAR
jgi:tRNA pseudouridine38-40 synthase